MNISNNSNIINKSKSKISPGKQLINSKSIHNLLYTESEIKNEKKKRKEEEIIKKIYPFKPELNEKTKALTNKNETKEEFINRLYNSKKEAEEIIIRKKRPSDANKDPYTGEKLFVPKISRGPKNPNQREITVNLDSHYDYLLLEKKKKLHEEEMLNNLQKKKIYLETSMKGVMRIKLQKYKEIFNLLDSDKDGFISYKNIKLSELNSDVLQSLTPLFEDLQKKGNYIDFKEFSIKADDLLAVKIFGSIE